jgi:hypothetical protein
MAASITTFAIHFPAPAAASNEARPSRRRRITHDAGLALEKLGHAIEYLTDEFVHQGADFPHKGELDAVQMLMALNRQVYFNCPEVPSVGERLRSLLHLRAA